MLPISAEAYDIIAAADAAADAAMLRA